MSLMGIDVGTTGCKAVVFDEDGKILATAYREYPLLRPFPGWDELEPDRVWGSVSDCIREVNAQVKRDPVKALCVSAQGEAVIPLDKSGTVLGNSPVSSDTRTIAQVERLKAHPGAQAIYAITGQPTTTLYTVPKIMWWREHQPDLYARVWKFLCYGDFVTFKLTGEPVIDRTMAARMLAMDIRTNQWSNTILSAADIDAETLPIIQPSGYVVGEILAAAAGALGFERGVQVIIGGHDQPCGALGAGVLHSGEGVYALGTTAAMTLVIDAPSPALATDYVPCYPHVVPDALVVLVGNQTGGRLLRWYRDAMGAEERATAARDGRDVYDVIVGQIGDAPSPVFVLPHFAGSSTLFGDIRSKGAILGLTFDTTRADIIKACLEGVAFEQALIMRHLRAAGVKIDRLKAVGGGSRSAAWMQITADITATPVTAIKVSEAASLGAALLAGWATGVYPSLEAAVARTVTAGTVYEPQPERSALYQQRLDLYARLYPLLREFNAIL